MEPLDYINREQLSIAMRVVKGDCDFTRHELPENLALFLGGMTVNGDPKKTCIQEILRAYKTNRKETINLANEIGLDLREYGMTRKLVFGK